MEELYPNRNLTINDDGAAMLLDCLHNVKVLGLEECDVSEEMKTKLKNRGDDYDCVVWY